MVRDHEPKPHDVSPYALRDDRPQDENLDEMADNIRRAYRDRLVLFLGAGASVGAVADAAPGRPSLPTAVALRNDLWGEFLLPESERAGFDFGKLDALSLDQAAAFAETRIGRTPVAEYIASRFRTRRPLWQHAVLPFLKPRALYTTNYDLLVEQGWSLQVQNHGMRHLVPIFSSQHHPMRTDTPLYKPHGSAERAHDPVGSGGPIITTIDYFEMIVDKKTMLDRWLDGANNACVLMIGYSMADMDIAARLYDIKKHDGGLHWYAVFPRDDDTVRKYWSEGLRIRHINRSFAELMVDLDKQLDFIPEDWKYDTLETHRGQGTIQ